MFLSQLFSWLLGRRPDYVDPTIVAQSEGREGNFSFNDEILLCAIFKVLYNSFF